MMRSASSLLPAQHDHGYRVVGTHLPQHVEPAHLRQTEVEHDQLRRVIGDLVERGSPSPASSTAKPSRSRAVRTTSTSSRSSSTTRIIPRRLGGRPPGSRDHASGETRATRETLTMSPPDRGRLRLLRHPGAGHRLGGPRRDPGPPRTHAARPPAGDVVERRHRRHRARRAVPQPRPLPGVAAGAARRHAARGRRPPRRVRRDPRRAPRRAGRAGARGLRRGRGGARRRCAARGLRLAICSNWDWDLEPAVAEAGLAGRFDIVVSSAWAGARKPHPRIYRYLLEQARSRPGHGAVRRRHLGPRRGGPARRRHDDRCTSSATATGPTRPQPPDATAARDRTDPRPHRRPADWSRTTCRPGQTGRRGDASDDADVLRFFALAAGTDVELDAPVPLPGCGSRCPGWPRSARTRRARPHGR